MNRLRLVAGCLLASAVLLVAALAVGFAAGWRLQPVTTGSMAPTYPAGSLVLVAPLDGGEVREGRAIVFADPLASDRLVLHRVVRAGDRPATWVTQGDGNLTPDPVPVEARQVRGQVVASVPGGGPVVTALQAPGAPLLLIGGPLALLLLSEWRRRRGPTGRHLQPAAA